MKINQIPRQEDVIEIELGSQKILFVPVTDQNTSYLIKAIFSTYLGEKCKYCDKKYKTLDDLKDTVWAGEHKHGRLACQSCWSENNKADIQRTK